MESRMRGNQSVYGEIAHEVIAGLDNTHRRRPDQPLHFGVCYDEVIHAGLVST